MSRVSHYGLACGTGHISEIQRGLMLGGLAGREVVGFGALCGRMLHLDGGRPLAAERVYQICETGAAADAGRD